MVHMGVHADAAVERMWSIVQTLGQVSSNVSFTLGNGFDEADALCREYIFKHSWKKKLLLSKMVYSGSRPDKCSITTRLGDKLAEQRH